MADRNAAQTDEAAKPAPRRRAAQDGRAARLGNGPGKPRFLGRGAGVHVLPVERQPRFEPQRVASAQADGLDRRMHEQRARQALGSLRRHRDLESVLTGVARAGHEAIALCDPEGSSFLKAQLGDFT